MKYVNLTDIARQIAGEWKIPFVQSRDLCRRVFDIIESEVYAGKTVNIKDFGKFTLRTRAPRIAMDLDHDTIEIPERCMPVFKPATNFKFRKGGTET